MEEELKNITSDTANKIASWVEGAEGFVSEQAPLYATELVRAEMAVSFMGMFICIILMAFFIKCAHTVRTKLIPTQDDEDDNNFNTFVVSAVCALFCIAPFGIGVENLMDFIHVWLAPRVFILDHLRDFV